MTAQEGALYGRRTRWPSALVLYIMDRVNPGLPEHFRVEWPSIVGSTPWLMAWEHMTKEDLDWFYSEPPPDMVSELEAAMEEVYNRGCEESARMEGRDQPIPPSRAEEQARDLPGMPPQIDETLTGLQPPALSPVCPQERPNKFIPDEDWTLIIESKTTMGNDGKLPDNEGKLTEDNGEPPGDGDELPVLTGLEVELGMQDVHDILGNYLDKESANAVRDLIRDNPDLARGDPTVVVDTAEAMDVDPPPVLTTEAQDQPMETEHQGASLGTFRPELADPGYTPSLVTSTGTPPSPITATDNALLDTANPETLGVNQSKAPGAGLPEGSPNKGSPAGSAMMLQKRKPPLT